MDHVFDFVANTRDGVFAVDNRQSIVLWNDAATAILGFSVAETLGKSCCEILGGRDAEGRLVCYAGCAAITSALRDKLPPTREILTRTKKGEEVWLSISSIVVPSQRSELTVLIHVFRNVTTQHEVMQVATELVRVASGLSSSAARKPRDLPRPEEGAVALTRREREVLAELATGASTETIASRLYLSPRTVNNHISSIIGKFGVHNRLEAVVYAVRHGLL